MNSAAAADNALNRSLKSGLTGTLASHRVKLAHHLPGRREDPFGADLLPELEVERAIVGLSVPQHACHDHSSFAHRRDCTTSATVQIGDGSYGVVRHLRTQPAAEELGVGGRFLYHVHEAASADFSIGGGLGLFSQAYPTYAPAEVGRCAVEAVVRIEVDGATLVGTLPDGTGIPADTSRRLLCDAGIVALAEDENRTPLALGRKRRTVSTALRRALRARDGGCQFPACTNHRFVDAHHIHHWVDGGETNLEALTLLCRRHHRFVHEFGFSVERGEDGLATFRNPHGWIVPPTGERALRRAADIERTRAALVEAGIVLDGSTNAPRWDGTNPDYALCIEALSDADRPRQRTNQPLS